MRRPPLLDPALFVGALVLGIYLTLTAESPTTSELELRTENVLPAFSEESIVALRWEVPQAFSLTRDRQSQDATRYFLGSADRRPADEEAMRSLLRLLDLASFRRTLGGGSQLKGANLGFEKPRMEMHIDAGPRSYRIVAGGKAPAPENSVYLKVEGTNVETKIGVVDESVVSQLIKTEQEFLGGLVFPLGRGETRSLKLTSEKGEVQLVPGEHAYFVKSSSGEKFEADRDLVDLIFFQLARVKMETYLESKSQVTMPVRVEQESAEGAKYIADLGAPCPGDPDSILVHRREPDELLGCASRTVLAALLIEESKLRSLTATSMSPDEIDHVVIRSPEKTLDVIRDGQEYKLVSAGQKPIERAAGDEFLKGLSRAKLVPIMKPDEELKATADITIKGQVRNTVLTREKDRTDHPTQVRLQVHQAGAHLYIRRESDASWLAVQESEKWLFLPDDAWARERRLTSFGEAQIDRVKITLPGGESWEVGREGERLVLTASASASRAADPALARELFRTLAELEAHRYVTPALPRPQTGLLQINFDVNDAGSSKTWNLWIGSRIRGGYLAWSDLTEATFVLPLGARLPFETPLIDRRAFHLDLEEQQRFSIETENGEIVFERQAGVLRSVGGEANDDMLEPIEEGLDTLRVVSAAGKHPAARDIRRGKPDMTIRAVQRSDAQNEGKSLTLHFGSLAVWQGISCRTAWIEGEEEIYFIEEASLSPLHELL